MTPIVLLALLMPFVATAYAMYMVNAEYVHEDDEPEDQGIALNRDGTLPEDL